MTVERAIDILHEKLSPGLFDHCSGVAKVAVKLAVKLNCDVTQACLAGWLHDCARGLSDEELLSLADEYNVQVDMYAKRCPVLLHAPVGAMLAHSWGFTDEVVLEAIRHHTLGIPKMTALGQIVYAADKIEPGRTYQGVERLRLNIEKDFDTGILDAVAQSINYVLQRKLPVHPLTVAFWNWLTENLNRE